MKYSSLVPAPLAAILLPSPAAAAEIQIAVTNPVVELTVTETVMSTPDTAQVGAGVSVRAPTAQEALRRNAEQMDRVVKKLREIGIAREDIQTSNFSLNAQYRYNNGTDATFIGYDASNAVNVTLRDMNGIGRALDTLVAAGANNVYGPNFSLEKDQDAKTTGRKLALTNARSRAMEYTQQSGFTGLRLRKFPKPTRRG
ncbi:MAG: SIMPL domain-containing protein [Sphingomonadaceae bacterium]